MFVFALCQPNIGWNIQGLVSVHYKTASCGHVRAEHRLAVVLLLVYCAAVAPPWPRVRCLLSLDASRGKVGEGGPSPASSKGAGWEYIVTAS